MIHDVLINIICIFYTTIYNDKGRWSIFTSKKYEKTHQSSYGFVHIEMHANAEATESPCIKSNTIIHNYLYTSVLVKIQRILLSST